MRRERGAVRVVQAFLDTSTVLATYLLARRWLSERKSILAALLVAIHPYLIYFTALVLSETLYTAMLAWGMALMAREKRSRWWAGAIVLALSVLVRPSAILLPVVLAIGAAVVNRGRGAAYSIAVVAAGGRDPAHPHRPVAAPVGIPKQQRPGLVDLDDDQHRHHRVRRLQPRRHRRQRPEFRSIDAPASRYERDRAVALSGRPRDSIRPRASAAHGAPGGS